jgi:hypothetical protein
VDSMAAGERSRVAGVVGRTARVAALEAFAAARGERVRPVGRQSLTVVVTSVIPRLRRRAQR